MVPAGSDQVPTLETGFDDVAWAELIRARVHDQTRLAAVASTGLVDTELEEVFDRLTRLAAVVLGVRWAFVTLVDDRRSFWKSCFGTGAVEIADRANPVEESFCQYVVASGTALLIDDARLDPRTSTNASIEKMGVLAWAGAPVVSASGQVLGTFCVVDSRPRSWTDVDKVTLETLAGAAASEVQLRTALQAATDAAARLSAELAVRVEIGARSRRLADLGRELSAVSTADEVSRIVASMGRDVLGAQFVNVHVLTMDAMATSVIHSPSVDPGIVDDYSTIPLATVTPAATAISTRAPAEAETFDDYARQWPSVADDARNVGVGAAAAWPLFQSDGAVIGVLSVGWDSPTEFTALLRNGLSTVSQMCASALERARLADVRSAFLLALHEALLPALPTVPGVDVAGRYLPATNGVSFGGDWYDVLSLSPSLVAVIVGDVCGHGIEAAATMAQLRGAMNTVVRLFHDTLADVFTHAELLRADTRDFIATIAVHLIDVSTGIVRYVSAGHPPTIIVRVDGTMDLLEEGRRPVFGLGAPGRTVGTTSLGRGDILVAYTDGLVETRERPLDHGIDQVASTVRRTLGRSATETVQAIERQTPRQRTDDVAFIVVTRTAAAM